MGSMISGKHIGLEVRDNPGHMQAESVICWPYDQGAGTYTATLLLDVNQNQQQ